MDHEQVGVVVCVASLTLTPRLIQSLVEHVQLTAQRLRERTCLSESPSEPSASASSMSAAVSSTSPDANDDRPSCAAMTPLHFS